MIRDILNEAKADAQVIEILMRENNKLRRKIPMPLLKLADGRVIRVDEEDFTEVSNEELEAEAAELAEHLAEVQGLLPKPADQPSEPAQPEAPAEPQPAEVPHEPQPGEVAPTPEPPVVNDVTPSTPEQPGITLG